MYMLKVDETMFTNHFYKRLIYIYASLSLHSLCCKTDALTAMFWIWVRGQAGTTCLNVGDIYCFNKITFELYV